MRALNLNQNGAGHLVVVFALIFIGAAGFAGYKVMNPGQSANETSVTTDSSDDGSAATVPQTIDSKADLAQTEKALDASAAEISSGLDDSQFEADMQEML